MRQRMWKWFFSLTSVQRRLANLGWAQGRKYETLTTQDTRWSVRVEQLHATASGFGLVRIHIFAPNGTPRLVTAPMQVLLQVEEIPKWDGLLANLNNLK